MANVITAEQTGHVVGPYGDLALDKKMSACSSIKFDVTLDEF